MDTIGQTDRRWCLLTWLTVQEAALMCGVTDSAKPGDDNVFFKKEFIYGVDARCNAGYGLWQLAFGSTGEADMPKA